MPQVCIICGDDSVAAEVTEELAGGFVGKYFYCRKHYKENWKPLRK